MPGTLAELYAGMLRQEPNGILGAARFNPLMMAKALRQQQAVPRPSLQEVLGNYPQTWQQFGDNLKAAYPTDSPAAVRQAAFEAAKNAGPLMTVWQGSPHRFAPTKNNPLGEFDATKIGSGEGAQAYGYGHYFAENKTVAKDYQKMLAPKTVTANKSGKSVPIGGATTPEEWAAEVLATKGGDVNAALKHVKAMESGGFFDAAPELQSGIESVLRSGKLTSATTKQGGHIYKVDLPDEHIGKMLDWDKPLSQQPESVRKAIGKIQGEVTGPFRDSMTGDEILRHIQATLKGVGRGSEKAESVLRDAGIPGIRYLDGGSRGAGTGTSNFVVFPGNEGILKILARE